MDVISALPDTSVAQAAIRLAQSTESPSVFNHSVRSYLFGELVAAHEGMRPGADYDGDALFLGCVLHDLGAGSAAPGKARFEVEGADLAATLLTEHGCERMLVDGVWEAIALHTSMGIADRFGPLCHLVRSGVGSPGRNSARHRPVAEACQSRAALASARPRAYVRGCDGRELRRAARRLARPRT